MKLKNKEIPCGCEQRQEIMFDYGNVSPAEWLIVGIPLAVLIIIAINKYGAE